MVCGNTELQRNYMRSHPEILLQFVIFAKSRKNNMQFKDVPCTVNYTRIVVGQSQDKSAPISYL